MYYHLHCAMCSRANSPEKLRRKYPILFLCLKNLSIKNHLTKQIFTTCVCVVIDTSMIEVQSHIFVRSNVINNVTFSLGINIVNFYIL